MNGQRHGFARDSACARRGIKRDCPCCQDNLLHGRFPAEQRTHACQHLIDGKWFDQVIVSSLVQSGNAFPDSIPRRDDQNGRPVAFGSELFQDLKPIHPGEHQIKEKQVICLLDMDLRERAGSIVCGVDGIVLLLQRISDRLADIRFVFNYQDSHLSVLPRYYVCVQRLMALSDPDNTGILRFVLRQIIASVEVPFPDDRFLPRTQYHRYISILPCWDLS